MTPGSIVRCRNREWVLLPSDEPKVFLLRPLTGATGEAVAVYRRLVDLAAYSLPEERVRSATFPPPTLDDLSNAAASHLLWQAARLTLREGATPFRSLGRISIRPRTYLNGRDGLLLHVLCEASETSGTAQSRLSCVQNCAYSRISRNFEQTVEFRRDMRG
ncbi:MAG: hypothetical protein AB9869_23550 [Verrucomicrobiia bacterium]